MIMEQAHRATKLARHRRLATYVLGILDGTFRAAAVGVTRRPGPDDQHRLRSLRDMLFVASVRGAGSTSDNLEQRARPQGQRRYGEAIDNTTSVSDDTATAELVRDYLRVKRGVEPSRQAVVDWCSEVIDALDRLSEQGWRRLTPSQQALLQNDVREFLLRLAERSPRPARTGRLTRAVA